MTDKTVESPEKPAAKKYYGRLLLTVAGLGGLLYGIDVGIIAGALPYLEATSGLNQSQLSFVVAAVLLGSVISTLFAGAISEVIGRKWAMILSGLLFVVSVPAIALSHNYGALVFGRLLQGMSAGLIGVVVPLYLAECLGPATRGRGTALFQWLLTLGIVVAAVIGFAFSIEVARMEKLGDTQKLVEFKDVAWRSIFWASLPPGVIFVFGALLVGESPRWLFARGKEPRAMAELLRSRSSEEAETEIREMRASSAGKPGGEGNLISAARSLLRRKYVVPFLLACIILACNQATGINSIIGYNAMIFIQAGLGDMNAHVAYVILTMVNFLFTIVAVMLVDRKGRKFLLSLGTGGVVISLICAGLVFGRTESQRIDVRESVQKFVGGGDGKLAMNFDPELFRILTGADPEGEHTLVVFYSFGGFRSSSPVVRCGGAHSRIELSRDRSIPSTPVAAFFQNPFADLAKARTAPLVVDAAFITPVPSERNGWIAALCIFAFIAFFSLGPGVCVWLALSELMPTRIRSNGMSVALLINQVVSTAIAASFLPTVGRFGYSTAFFFFAACTVVYFVVATFFLPETKGKTLEEIEEIFSPPNKA